MIETRDDADYAVAACDWWHGVPQLFYLVAGFDVDLNIPSSCSTVNLKWVQG